MRVARTDLRHQVEIDQVGAMHANEPVGIETTLQLLESQGHQEPLVGEVGPAVMRILDPHGLRKRNYEAQNHLHSDTTFRPGSSGPQGPADRTILPFGPFS